MVNWGGFYPPGCSGTPYDEPDPPCDVCGEFPEECICPECPACGSYGDPRCYLDHGLRRSEQQKFNLECHNRLWEQAAIDENRYWAALEKEHDDKIDEWLDEQEVNHATCDDRDKARVLHDG